MKNSKTTRQQRQYIFRDVRVRYPRIFEPETSKFRPKPEFSIQVLLGPNEEAPAFKAYLKHLKELFKIEFGDDAKSSWEAYRRDKTFRIQWSEQAGQFYVTVRRNAQQGKPTAYDAQNTPLDPLAGVPKSGDYCDVMEDTWIYDQGRNSRGASGTLMGVRFKREGDPLGGAPVATAGSWDDLSNDGSGAEDFI